MTVRRPFVALAAGGTGGHVFPAEALAGELIRRGCRLALVTDARGTAFGGGNEDVEIHRVPAGGLAGKGLAARLRGVAALLLGTLRAWQLFGADRPDAVVGFGGYASVPPVLAAILRGLPTVLHEQNAVLGRANRLLAGRAARIATSFPEVRAMPAGAGARHRQTGMPVRPAVLALYGASYAAPAEGPIRLLVLGGSQGARVFGQVVPAALGRLNGDLRGRVSVVQQCRAEDLEAVEDAYVRLGIAAELKTFFDDVPARLAAAHLVITRAGASTVAEVLAAGRPAILVPYPFAVDNHQTANAQAVAGAGAGWLMAQETFTAETLAERLSALLRLPATLSMAAAAAHATALPDAAARLADVVFELLPQTAGDPA